MSSRLDIDSVDLESLPLFADSGKEQASDPRGSLSAKMLDSLRANKRGTAAEPAPAPQPPVVPWQGGEGTDSYQNEDASFWSLVQRIRAQAADTQARDLEERLGLTEEDQQEFGRKNILAAIDDLDKERITRQGQSAALTDLEKAKLARAVFDQMFALGRFQPYVDDPTVENIHVLGCDEVYIERVGGKKEKVSPVAESDEQLMIDLQFLASRGGEAARSFSSAHPDLDMDLLGYVRLAAAAPPIVQRPTAIFRIHRHIDISIDQMVQMGTFSAAAAHFMQTLVRAGKSVVIAGYAGDGKTTLMRALADTVPAHEQIVTIETERELHLGRLSSRAIPPISFQYRPPGESGAGEYTLERAMAKSLRMNSTRIFVGEVRGDELVAMIRAMQTGAGTFSTTHASSPDDCLENLIGLGMVKYDRSYMEAQVGRHIDVVIQLKRVMDQAGNEIRKITHISEVLPAEGQRAVTTNNIFHLDPHSSDMQARFIKMPENPRLREDLLKAGLDPQQLEAGR